MSVRPSKARSRHCPLNHLQVAVGEDFRHLQHGGLGNAAPIRGQQGQVAGALHRVAGGQGAGDAPQVPGRRLVAPFQVAVLNVVVQQRKVVHQFQGRRRWQGRGVVVGQGVAGEEAQGGAQRLALGRRRIGRRAVAVGPAQMVAQQQIGGRGVEGRHGALQLPLHRGLVAGEHCRQPGAGRRAAGRIARQTAGGRRRAGRLLRGCVARHCTSPPGRRAATASGRLTADGPLPGIQYRIPMYGRQW